MLLFLYIFLVASGICDRIEHKFLTSGHSFSSSDRDLALIEKRAKYSKIQTVEDVKTVIAVARPSTPYWVLDTSEKCLEERNHHPGYCACATRGLTSCTTTN